MPGVMTLTPSKGGVRRLQNVDTLRFSLVHKSYTPPFLRLPNELLAYILDLAVHASSDREDFDRVPVILSQVSSRIRSVARATGSLWTRIVFTFPFDSEDLISLAIRLSLSKGCPLDVCLDLRDPEWDWDLDSDETDHDFTADDMQILLTVLLPHARRFRSLEVLCDTWEPVHAFLSRTQTVGSLPLLETLRLARCNAYFAKKGQVFEPESLKAPLPLFGGATLPRLKQLSLSGVHVDWQSLSLTGLTSLELKFHAADIMPSVDAFSDLLAGCSSSLTSLNILGWGPQFYDKTESLKPIVMPHVTKFHVGFLDVTYGSSLLSILEFPKLAYLYLEDLSPVISPEDRTDASAVLETLLTSHEASLGSHMSLASLTSLTLHGMITRLPVTQDFLSHLTSLVELNLFSLDNAIFRSLLPTAPAAPVGFDLPCPSVESISCRSVDVISLAGLVGLRKSMNPSLPLHQLIFIARDTTNWSALEPIQLALANVGVSLELTAL
ncbi:hypothetical protein DL96DRAFT_1492799 [Flagelloscypha sp. PMI_526]|nr:hypothetical protein DL96DRAFT_1492799 [Flagelloscypha sp. PMI_526]